MEKSGNKLGAASLLLSDVHTIAGTLLFLKWSY